MYKIPAGVKSAAPGKTVQLSVVGPGVTLPYGTSTARTLRLRACKPGTPGFGTNPPIGEWTGWAGGIVMAQESCVHLVVKEGSRRHHIRLGLGVRCP